MTLENNKQIGTRVDASLILKLFIQCSESNVDEVLYGSVCVRVPS